MNSLTIFTLTIAFFVSVASAADSVKPASKADKQTAARPTYLDPSDAGPDYAYAGEYTGELSGGKGKLAAQVVALGDGRFSIIFLTGGLPGDGWDGRGRAAVDGQRVDDKVNFSGGQYSGVLANDVITDMRKPPAQYRLKKVQRTSPREGAKPPREATVLFDGTNADAWEDGKIDARHLLEAGTKTKKKYQDFTLHVEFLLPFKPFARDQDRGNSGIYIQDRYEIQILDTFGHPEEFNGCGSTYRQTAPKINMCYPPLRWQTYDIDFTAARWDGSGKKTANARVTVRQNGVIVQDNTELPSKTGAGRKEGPEPGPIQLQGHHNPVFFRNIWVIEKK